jgi:hypothetical protein
LDRVGEGVKAVGAGEGDVARGVPVLGKDDVMEESGEGVDAGENGIAIGYGKGAAGEKVELHVDDEKCVRVAELHKNKRTILCKGSCWRDAETSDGASERHAKDE